jgi:hypothetical protein
VVRQIRATIRSLRDPSTPTGLLDRLHAEAARAHGVLGFEPELDVHADGDPDALVGSEVADDLVAVMSLRAAANQFGYLLGAATGGAALAFGGFPALGLMLAALFLTAVLVHAPALITPPVRPQEA